MTTKDKASSTAVNGNTNTTKNQIDVDCSSGSCIDMNGYIAKTYQEIIKHRKINQPEYWILYHNPRYKRPTISILHVISSSANIGHSVSIKCISNGQSKQWENVLRNIVKLDDKRTIRISPNLVGTDILQKITEIINSRHVPIKLSLNAYEEGDKVLLNTTEVIGAMHKEIDKLLNLKYSDNLVNDLDKIFNMRVENSSGNYSTVKFGLSTYYINWLDTITSITPANNEFIELLNGDSIEITNPVTGMLGVTPANSLFDYREMVELRSHIYRGRQKLVDMIGKIPDEKVREEVEAVSNLIYEQFEADIEAEDININESEYPNYVKYRQLRKYLAMLDEWYSAIYDNEANR